MWQELIFDKCYLESCFENYKKYEISPRELFHCLNSICEALEREPKNYENILIQIYHFVKSQVIEQLYSPNNEIISNLKWRLCILRKISNFIEEKNGPFLYDIIVKLSKTEELESIKKSQYICLVFEELTLCTNFKKEEEITIVETMGPFLYILEQNYFSLLQPFLENFFNSSENIQSLSDKLWSQTISMLTQTKIPHEIEKFMLHFMRMSEIFIKNLHKYFIKSLFQYYNDSFKDFILSVLVHTDTLTRKRAISFLNFFVVQSQHFEFSKSDVCHENLLCSLIVTSSLNFWLSFIEMLTTLEETQYHIIKPVIISFQKSLASVNKADINPLWLLTLAIRMVNHNCKLVSKKGVGMFLQIILYYDALYNSNLYAEKGQDKSTNTKLSSDILEYYLELCLNCFVEKLFPLLINANFFYKKRNNEYKINEDESVDVAESLNDFFSNLQGNEKLMALFTKKFLTVIKETQRMPVVVDCILFKAFTFYFHDTDETKKSKRFFPYSESSALFKKSYFREEIDIANKAYILEVLQMITNDTISSKNLMKFDHPSAYGNSMQYFSHVKRNQKTELKIAMKNVIIFLDEDLERFYIETYGAFQRNHLKLHGNSDSSSYQQDEQYEDFKADLDALKFTESYGNFPVLNPLDHRLSTYYKPNILFMKFLVAHKNRKNPVGYLLETLEALSGPTLIPQLVKFVIDLMTKFYEYTVFCSPTDEHDRSVESCFKLCEYVSNMLVTHLPGEEVDQSYESILDAFLAFLTLVDAFISLESDATKFKKLKMNLENHARLLNIPLLNAIMDFGDQWTGKVELFGRKDFLKFEGINTKLIFMWLAAYLKKYNTGALSEENKCKCRSILTQIIEYVDQCEFLYENHSSILFSLLKSDISTEKKCHLLENSNVSSFEHQLITVYTVLKSESKKSELCSYLEETILKSLNQMLSSAVKTIKYMYIFSNDLCFLITQAFNQRFYLSHNLSIFFAKAVIECITNELVQDDLSRLKAELMADYYIKNLEVPLKEYINEASIPRARLLFFISQFDSSNKCKLIGAILEQLVNQYKTTLECKKRCYGNSQMHRLKQRLISAIFLFEFMDEFSNYFPMFLETLSKESQPSVRFISIIAITRMLSSTHQHDHMFVQVFSAFEKASKDSSTKPSHLISSILLTVYFLRAWMRKVVSGETSVSEVQKECVVKGLLSLIFLTSTPHSLTRVHAQASILALCSQAIAFVDLVESMNVTKTHEGNLCINDDTNHDIKQLNGFETVVGAMKTLIMFSNFFNSSKNSYKLAHNCCESFLMMVDPFKDISFELIFHMLPLYFGMSLDEAISPSLFDHSYTIYPSDSRSWLALFLPPERKSVLVNSMRTSSWKEANEDSKKPNDFDDDEEDVGHFQKKIITYKTTKDDRKNSLRGGNNIILVASLVDSAANLGGLCRTCEILGVDRMMVRDRKVINTSDFESLSVTAYKWIKIDELPLKDLKDFLRSRKTNGWNLIGLEQTSKSEPLQHFTFPQKCIILLGNERSGIPVNLIQLMDKCLEIPQVGVVRSLNVHVSGALVLWECLKQRINKADATP